MSKKIDKEVLFGMTKEHLIYDESINRYFHKDSFEDFKRFKEDALKEGIDFYVTSSFRSFDDQLRIWNEKCAGKRPIYDRTGNELDHTKLSPSEIVSAIINWSALPGTSRHHWGTELDVVDGNSWPEGYHIQLVPEEFSEGGPFFEFNKWLNAKIEDKCSYSYYRPYVEDLGGVAPEAWHISYNKVSSEYHQEYTYDLFCELLEHPKMNELTYLKEVKASSQEIYHHFFKLLK
ncbi:M15 family metallopeptidase [Halobacteriovorax sp. HFRX-2_2]|uniref:M15 family metallopeptidase n=1 Tax=unclassified Halobacteriovorax TaxID=2639665 RepID=UPI003715871C